MSPRYVSPLIRRRPRSAPDDSIDGLITDNITKTKQIQDSGAVKSANSGAVKSANSDAVKSDFASFEIEPPEESDCVAEGTYRQIRDYSLVLLSQEIVHRLERTPEGPFQIFVAPANREKAEMQLDLYRRENPPKEENPPLPLSISPQPLWVLLVPVVCTFADFGGFVERMHIVGLSDADKVMHGEWWRTITALTLHGDSRHLMSNLLCGFIVLNLMSFRIPLARMVPFLAVASAIANFCVVLTVQTDYRALGFSTFVFAAIGCLAVIEFRLMPKETHGMLRRFAPLCGALSLAVFLGLGENADILGHAYGFVAGLLCGLLPKKKTLRWGTPTALADLVWVALYFAFFAVAWKFALAP